MSYQYNTCTKGGYKSSGAHDWRVRKDEITCRFKYHPKFDGVTVILVFSVIG